MRYLSHSTSCFPFSIKELNGSNVLKDVISQMIEHDPDLRMAITNVKTELEGITYSFYTLLLI